MLRDYTLTPTDVPVHAPAWLTSSRRDELKADIKRLLAERDAVLVAHYYVDADIQDLAEETGGCVADSLEMARFGRDHAAPNLVVAGVRFMGETAKILSPEKGVFMPTLEAECSLDLGCPPDEFRAFTEANADRTVVVYANTSVAVKAMADWVVTSSVGLKIVEHLAGRGEKILWAPDKHLGSYIQAKTGADMLLWSGACVVHEEFKLQALHDMKAVYPDAGVLVHPESPAAVIDEADCVGSTSQIIQAARDLPHDTFIVATDRGIFHKLRKSMPDKRFIEAPTAGDGAMCRSCAHCPWMAMNELEALAHTLESLQPGSARGHPSQVESLQPGSARGHPSPESHGDNEIRIDPDVGARALRPLQRMLEFQA